MVRRTGDTSPVSPAVATPLRLNTTELGAVTDSKRINFAEPFDHRRPRPFVLEHGGRWAGFVRHFNHVRFARIT